MHASVFVGQAPRASSQRVQAFVRKNPAQRVFRCSKKRFLVASFPKFLLRSALFAARDAQPSDGMKKEMEGLVEQLGADGIEAKRQVWLTALQHFFFDTDPPTPICHTWDICRAFDRWVAFMLTFTLLHLLRPAHTAPLHPRSLKCVSAAFGRFCTKRSQTPSSASQSSPRKIRGVGGQAAAAALLCQSTVAGLAIEVPQNSAERAFLALRHHRT